MSDLAAMALAAIGETERNRWRVHDQECDFGSHTTNLTDLTIPSAVCDCPEPERIARRCAADRKIVAEVRGLSDGVLKDDLVAALGDLVLARLAEGYGIEVGQ